MSLILESPDLEMNKLVIAKTIEKFYETAEEMIIKEMLVRKKEALEKAAQGNVQQSCFKSESQIIVNKMKKCEL